MRTYAEVKAEHRPHVVQLFGLDTFQVIFANGQTEVCLIARQLDPDPGPARLGSLEIFASALAGEGK